MQQWEYKTFTEPLPGNTYGIVSVPYDGGVFRTSGGNLAQDIEQAVDRLLARVTPERWEPVEDIDASSLWRAQHVTMRVKKAFIGNDKVIATEVRCRRART